jgi:hypothetical protein
MQIIALNYNKSVIPAKAGIQFFCQNTLAAIFLPFSLPCRCLLGERGHQFLYLKYWIPAFAGMTDKEMIPPYRLPEGLQ